MITRGAAKVPGKRNRLSKVRRPLNSEELESRQLMAASITNDNGIVEIRGGNTAETVEIRYHETRPWNIQVRVDGRFQKQWNYRDFRKVVYFGNGGDDVFTNNTKVPTYADGGSGNDVIQGGSRNDDLFGGAGDDRVYGGEGDDRIRGNSGHDQLYGQGGDDWLWGWTGDDWLNGGSGSDHLYGHDGNDGLYGSTGDDFLYGENGNDVLKGRAGHDVLFGGAGDDRLIGGEHDDQMDGQAGHDVVDFGDSSTRVTVNLQAGYATGEGADEIAGVEQAAGQPFMTNAPLVGQDLEVRVCFPGPRWRRPDCQNTPGNLSEIGAWADLSSESSVRVVLLDGVYEQSLLLSGEGSPSQLIIIEGATPNGVVFLSTPSSNATVVVDNSQNIILRNLNFRQESLTRSGDYMKIRNSTDVFVENSTWENLFVRYSALNIVGSDRVLVQNCEFSTLWGDSKSGNHAIYVAGASDDFYAENPGVYSEMVHVRDCRFTDHFGAGSVVKFKNGVYNAVVTNSTFVAASSQIRQGTNRQGMTFNQAVSTNFIQINGTSQGRILVAYNTYVNQTTREADAVDVFRGNWIWTLDIDTIDLRGNTASGNVIHVN